MSAPTVEVVTGHRSSAAAARAWRDGFIAGARDEPAVCPNGFGKVRVFAWFVGHAAGKAWRSREGEQG